jgi:hypothetical protein
MTTWIARETNWKAQSEFLQARQQRKHGPAAHAIIKIQDHAISFEITPFADGRPATCALRGHVFWGKKNVFKKKKILDFGNSKMHFAT